MLLIAKVEPITKTTFSDTFDTKCRAENFTNTDSDTNTNPYRHMVAMIIHLFTPISIHRQSVVSANLNVLINYDFLATTKPKVLILIAYQYFAIADRSTMVVLTSVNL